MKKQLISNAISNINDTHIEEAANYKPQKKIYKYLLIPAAACLCFVFMTLIHPFYSSLVLSQDTAEEKKIVTEINLPKTNIEEYLSADFVTPYVYYNNHYYFAYLQTNDMNLIGNYLATTISNDYKYYIESDTSDGINVYSTDIYSVNGYNSDFMISMPFGDNYLILINNNNYTITYGHDIFEEELHMLDRYKYISINTNTAGVYTDKYIRYNRTVDHFLVALTAAQWEYSDDFLTDNKEIYQVCFILDDGFVVRLRLYENAYVEFEGLPNVCLQVDNKIFNRFIIFLES